PNAPNNTVGVLDLRGLTGAAGFTASVTNFNVGQGAASGGYVFLTNTSNTITATTLNVGNSASFNPVVQDSTLLLGTGSNVIQANTINIGFSKSGGIVSFASQAPGSPGTVTIASTSGGAANITLGSMTGTAAEYTAILDLRGHNATVTANILALGAGNNTSSGSATGIVSFDSGTFSVNAVQLGFKVNGTGIYSGTINVGGGNFTVNNLNGGGCFT